MNKTETQSDALFLAAKIEIYAAYKRPFAKGDIARVASEIRRLHKENEVMKVQLDEYKKRAYVVDSRDTDLLDAMERHRIALVPEFEGQWDAEIYNDDTEAQTIASGKTPREALNSAISAKEQKGCEA